MWYITYDRSRLWVGESVHIEKTSGPYRQFRKRDLCPMRQRLKQMKRPLFKLTQLLGVADIQIIKGSKLNDNDYYCAISYSRNQSGDVIRPETSGLDDYICMDEGKHTIIDCPAKKIKTRGKPRGGKNFRMAAKTRQVKFPQLIQQICLDLDI